MFVIVDSRGMMGNGEHNSKYEYRAPVFNSNVNSVKFCVCKVTVRPVIQNYPQSNNMCWLSKLKLFGFIFHSPILWQVMITDNSYKKKWNFQISTIYYQIKIIFIMELNTGNSCYYSVQDILSFRFVQEYED